MSHGITATDTMFVTHKPAWHKLGVVVDHEIYSVQEAQEAAGLTWSVEKRQHYTLQPKLNDGVPVFNGSAIETEVVAVPKEFGIYRTDNNEFLGRCGNVYKPLQPSEAFRWFEPFLHERDVYIETAGSLKGGRVIWVMAKIKEGSVAEVVNGDPVEQRLLLSNSYDSSVSLQVSFVNERVVCANTLGIAMGEANRSGLFRSIRHTKSMKDKLVEVQCSIDLARRAFTENVESYKFLASKDCTTADFRGYLENLYAKELQGKDKDGNKYTLDTLTPTSQILRLRESSPDLQVAGVRGTWWSAYNAVTEYVTHYQNTRSEDQQVYRLWYGQDRKVLNDSLEKALQLTSV